MRNATVLVVEDDPMLREQICSALQASGFGTQFATDGQSALEMMQQHALGMVISEARMHPMDGYQLLRRVKALNSRLPVVLMTAQGTVEKAVRAMQEGAADFLVKPFAPETLVSKIDRFIIPSHGELQAVIAEDIRTRELLELARRVAQSEVTVLLGGESGTGKEVFARYIHQHSERSEAPFVAVNCAAIPENMLEAMLFGYEKGAFTGANQAVAGKFEQAQDGTLLLDEISEMSLSLQAKLLRVLQEKEVERLGGGKVIQLSVRVLATTNRRLREEVAAGRFREDLFYRLNVFPIMLPPLRERERDIIPLARHLLSARSLSGMHPPRISPAAEYRLLQHSWPGNVRELDNLMQRALILHTSDEIGVEDICFESDCTLEEQSRYDQVQKSNSLPDDLKSMEESMIIEALKQGNGSRKSAAERLGISQRTLRYKLAKLRDAGVSIPG